MFVEDYCVNVGDDDSVSSYCSHRSTRRDCDGDVGVYCTSFSSCPYKRTVKDCDGDLISLCDK